MTQLEKIKAEIERQIEELGMSGSVCVGRSVLLEMLDFVNSLEKEQEQPEVDLENYISNQLRELGADLINHKPYSFNRGLNVGKTNAYEDILNKLQIRKED